MAKTKQVISLDAPLIAISELSVLTGGRSIPSLERDDAAGRLPPPVRIGRSKRWRRQEILDWISAGCPNRQTWEAMNKKKTG